jgi:hypothetical protein
MYMYSDIQLRKTTCAESDGHVWSSSPEAAEHGLLHADLSLIDSKGNFDSNTCLGGRCVSVISLLPSVPVFALGQVRQHARLADRRLTGANTFG